LGGVIAGLFAVTGEGRTAFSSPLGLAGVCTAGLAATGSADEGGRVEAGGFFSSFFHDS
jgi:hypothetical protein